MLLASSFATPNEFVQVIQFFCISVSALSRQVYVESCGLRKGLCLHEEINSTLLFIDLKNRSLEENRRHIS